MLLTAAAIVAALGQLVAPDEQLPALGAPAQEQQADICPAPRGPTADEPVVVVADELIECPATFDGVTVSYRGETVRAVLAHGPTVWVHLNDDPYALELGPLYDPARPWAATQGSPSRSPRRSPATSPPSEAPVTTVTSSK